MVVSRNTAKEILRVMRSYMSDLEIKAMISDLLQVGGNKSFTDTLWVIMEML